MNIGIVPDPLSDPAWSQVKALLEPAAKLGGVPVLEPGEEVWTVIQNGQLLAAATARLTAEAGEVVLVGGTDHNAWIGDLDQMIGRWMILEGKKKVRAFGRKGWVRVLKNWEVVGERDGVTAYERELI